MTVQHPSPASGPSRRTFLRGSALAGGLAAWGVPHLVAPAAAGATPGSGLAAPQAELPSCCPGPFAHGVSSGDPLADRVILWTRLTPARVDGVPGPVRWEVATDPGMSAIVRSGEQTPVAEHDWTVKVDATGLAPATTYYYRFSHGSERSIVGRTRTAPAPGAPTARMRFAAMSCSSYWSSHWSGFENLAARDDIDLVVHLGDYVYDFPDKDELLRSPDGFRDWNHPDNRDWLDLGEVRRRYALWRSDPQFVRAHQQHPWMIVWDNHDLDVEYGVEVPTPGIDPATSTTTLADTMRAFWEWTPTRPVRADGSGRFHFVDDGSWPVPEDPSLIYRELHYGDLADVLGIDAQSRRSTYGLPVVSSHLADGQTSVLSRPQYEWLTGGLSASAERGTRWRVVANQAWFAPADIPELVQGVQMPQLGLGRWGEHPAERAALVEHLRTGGGAGRIRNTIMVSGDAHGSFASDIISTAHLHDGYVSGLPGVNLRPGAEPQNRNAGAVRVSTGNGGPMLPGGSAGPLAGSDALGSGAATGSSGQVGSLSDGGVQTVGGSSGSVADDPANVRGLSVGVEFAPTSMGRGGADETIRGAAGIGRNEATSVARAAEMAILTLNRNAQYVEWVDHGYGIVDLTQDRAVFEYWFQDKHVAGSPDVLAHQMVAWAYEDRSAVPPRFADQIDAVELHGLEFGPTAGPSIGAQAPRF